MAGSDLPPTASLFEKAVSQLEYVVNYVPIVVAAHFVAGGVFWTGKKFGEKKGYNDALKALLNGNYHEDRINVYDKRYLPSGEVNEETGREYFDQEIIIIDDTSHSEIFPNSKINQPILDALKKARTSAAADLDNPIIYLQLPDIIGEENWPAMKKAITGMAVKSLSKKFNHATNIADKPPSKRHRPIRRNILPLLVIENSSTGPEERLLLVHFQNGEVLDIPDIDHTRFEDPQSETVKRSYIVDPNSPQRNHHRLFEHVLEVLQDPDNGWLKDFSIDVHTGKYEEIVEPKPQE